MHITRKTTGKRQEICFQRLPYISANQGYPKHVSCICFGGMECLVSRCLGLSSMSVTCSVGYKGQGYTVLTEKQTEKRNRHFYMEFWRMKMTFWTKKTFENIKHCRMGHICCWKCFIMFALLSWLWIYYKCNISIEQNVLNVLVLKASPSCFSCHKLHSQFTKLNKVFYQICKNNTMQYMYVLLL